jgi:hypothetical protein
LLGWRLSDFVIKSRKSILTDAIDDSSFTISSLYILSNKNFPLGFA